MTEEKKTIHCWINQISEHESLNFTFCSIWSGYGNKKQTPHPSNFPFLFGTLSSNTHTDHANKWEVA